MMRISEAKRTLQAIGYTVNRHAGGDYRVCRVGGDEASAYYTDDLDDAVQTAYAERERESSHKPDGLGERYFNLTAIMADGSPITTQTRATCWGEAEDELRSLRGLGGHARIAGYAYDTRTHELRTYTGDTMAFVRLTRPPAYPVARGGGRIVNVTVPEKESPEPICRRCEQPGSKCGCEPCGDFA